MAKGIRRRFVAGALLLAACGVLLWVAPRYGSWLFPAYRSVCKAVTSVQALVTSVVPFALWDMATLVLAIATVAGLIRCIRRRRGFLALLSHLFFVLSVAAFLFVGWASNHYAPSLAHEIDLKVRQYSVEELARATSYYLLRAAELADDVPRTDGGELAEQDFYELARIGGAAYSELGKSHDVFNGSNVPVKALLLVGEPLLFSGHTGIYFPPTGEAGVPLRCAKADLPFIMCHEAAHRLAIASEQEANFAAFVACDASRDVRFSYSGYYNAFSYCYNALATASPELGDQVLGQAVQQNSEGVRLVLRDKRDTSEHYAAYDGPLQEVGTTVNDSYLKSFGEQSGVRSYGLVVDYLIAFSTDG